LAALFSLSLSEMSMQLKIACIPVPGKKCHVSQGIIYKVKFSFASHDDVHKTRQGNGRTDSKKRKKNL
jgi:hypothetical protein